MAMFENGLLCRSLQELNDCLREAIWERVRGNLLVLGWGWDSSACWDKLGLCTQMMHYENCREGRLLVPTFTSRKANGFLMVTVPIMSPPGDTRARNSESQ